MKYEHLSIFTGTSYDEECRYHLSLRVNLKTKAERKRLEKAIKDVLSS